MGLPGGHAWSPQHGDGGPYWRRTDQLCCQHRRQLDHVDGVPIHRFFVVSLSQIKPILKAILATSNPTSSLRLTPDSVRIS